MAGVAPGDIQSTLNNRSFIVPVPTSFTVVAGYSAFKSYSPTRFHACYNTWNAYASALGAFTYPSTLDPEAEESMNGHNGGIRWHSRRG